MRRRRIAALEQGHLDGLCGIYSVINALRLAAEHADDSHSWLRTALHDGWVEVLFSHLVRKALKKRRPSDFVYAGLNTANVARLIGDAGIWLNEFFELELTVRRPFYHRADAPLMTRCEAIAEHLAKPATAAIVGTADPWNHWTVVARVEPRRLALVDSGGLSYTPRRRERGFEDCHAGLIKPNSVFLLTIHARR